MDERSPHFAANPSPSAPSSPAGDYHGLVLSALHIKLLSPTFRGARRPYPGDAEYSSYRKRFPNTFFYRLQGAAPSEAMLVIPWTREAEAAWEGIEDLPCSDHLRALATLVKVRLPHLIPDWGLRHRDFDLERVIESDDLVLKAFRRLKKEVPPQLRAFHKYLRIRFSSRITKYPGHDPGLVLAFAASRRNVIDIDAKTARAAGLDLHGIWLLRRDRQRLPLGPVLSIENGNAVVKGVRGPETVRLEDCVTERSPATFARVFRQVLGHAPYAKYEAQEWIEQAAQLSGDGYRTLLRQIGFDLKNLDVLSLANGLDFQFAGALWPSREERRSLDLLGSPKYCFADGKASTPAEGLARLGPFDGHSFTLKEPQFLVLCPTELRGTAHTFVQRLKCGMGLKEPRRRPINLDDGGRAKEERFARGFVEMYQLTDAHFEFRDVELNGTTPKEIGERYVTALQEYQEHSTPDLVIVVVRDEDADNGGVENPYLMTKAYLLGQGLATQEVRGATLATPDSSLPYVLENFASAMYAKLGGIPWTIEPPRCNARELVMGLANATVGPRQEPKTRYVGITTVFSADGTYLLSATSPRCRFEDYPQRLTTTVATMLRRLHEECRWGDDPTKPVRLVIHTREPLKGVHLGRIFDAAIRSLPTTIQFETAFLTITQSHPFKVIDLDAKGVERKVDLAAGGRGKRVVAKFVPRRGRVIALGENQRLLCVSGGVQAKREGEPIPNPLQIELHRASRYRDLDALCQQVYHFTGLSWRSMLPISEPVTISYSRLIAELLNALDGIPHWNEQDLNARLAAMRWFL